jgi:hypothetical protein
MIQFMRGLYWVGRPSYVVEIQRKICHIQVFCVLKPPFSPAKMMRQPAVSCKSQEELLLRVPVHDVPQAARDVMPVSHSRSSNHFLKPEF